MAKKLVKRGSEVTSNSDAICKVTGLRHCDDSTKKEIVDYLVKIDKQNDIPVGLAGWFVDEINGLYAAHTYTPFDNLCKNADIRKDLKKVTVPKAVKLDYGQEYGLNKLSEQGVTVVYIE